MTVTIAGLHKDPFNEGQYYGAAHAYDTNTEVLGEQIVTGPSDPEPDMAFMFLCRKYYFTNAHIAEAFEVLEAETDKRPLRLRLHVELVKLGGPRATDPEDEMIECPRFRTYRQLLEYFREVQAEYDFVWSSSEIGWVSRIKPKFRVRAHYLDIHLVDPFNLERPASADCFHKESIERAMSLWDQPDVPVVPDQKIKLPLVEFSPLDETWVDDSDPEAFV